MSHEAVRTLIIGAGITGLSAAAALGGDALILEKEAEPGGYCRSFHRGGFTWDFAGHFFHFRSERTRRFFLNALPPEELIVKQKCSKIVYRGALIDYPFQTHLHQLPKEELIDCLYDLYFRESRAQYGSFLDMLYGSFGRTVTDRFLRPYNEKLYACSLDTLSEKAMGRFFPAADLGAVIAGMKQAGAASYNERFYYARSGAAAFVRLLCRGLDAKRIRTGRALAALDLDRHLATDSHGDSYRYDCLINSSPLHRFLPLTGSARLASLAAGLSCNKVLVLNLGFERKSPYPDLHWLYLPEPDFPPYRVGFYDNVLDDPRMSLYAEIAFPMEAEIRVDEQLARTLGALERHGLCGPGNRLIAWQALLMDPAYVHLRGETAARVEEIRDQLAQHDVYSIGRYGGWQYCSMEDCMLEAAGLAGRLKAGETL